MRVCLFCRVCSQPLFLLRVVLAGLFIVFFNVQKHCSHSNPQFMCTAAPRPLVKIFHSVITLPQTVTALVRLTSSQRLISTHSVLSALLRLLWVSTGSNSSLWKHKKNPALLWEKRKNKNSSTVDVSACRDWMRARGPCPSDQIQTPFFHLP